jgi:hypothetical protein
MTPADPARVHARFCQVLARARECAEREDREHLERLAALPKLSGRLRDKIRAEAQEASDG